jgi:hypothetical protein
MRAVINNNKFFKFTAQSHDFFFATSRRQDTGARMGDAQENEHQLWVNLSSLGDGNIFAILPQLMKKMLDVGDGGIFADDEPYDLVLPSDDTWQTKIYYKLVEQQRMADALEQK